MGEIDPVDRVGHRHCFAPEFRCHRLGIGALLHHGDAQRHIDGAGYAGRAGDDATLDADLHGHDAGVHVAFARGADDAALVAHVERAGFTLAGLAADQKRGRAEAHGHLRAIEIGIDRSGRGTRRTAGADLR